MKVKSDGFWSLKGGDALTVSSKGVHAKVRKVAIEIVDISKADI